LKNKDEEEKAKEEEKWNLKRLKEELKDKEELEKYFGGAPKFYETVYDIQKIEKLFSDWQVVSVERTEKKIDEASYKRNVSRPWRNKFYTYLALEHDLQEIDWNW